MFIRCTARSGGTVLVDMHAIVSVSEASGGATLIRTLDTRSWIVSESVSDIADAVHNYWGASTIEVGAATTAPTDTAKRKKRAK